MEIFRDQMSLRVKRTIDGRVVEGTAAVETAPLPEMRVRRMRFSEGDTPYECTCLLQGDLDNDARLTCQQYRQDDKPRRPGLGALFHRGAE